MRVQAVNLSCVLIYLQGGDVDRGHVDALEARPCVSVLHLHPFQDPLDICLEHRRRFRGCRLDAVVTSKHEAMPISACIQTRPQSSRQGGTYLKRPFKNTSLNSFSSPPEPSSSLDDLSIPFFLVETVCESASSVSAASSSSSVLPNSRSANGRPYVELYPVDGRLCRPIDPADISEVVPVLNLRSCFTARLAGSRIVAARL